MQAYPAYYENGRIVPVGNPVIPEGCELVITVLDKSLFSDIKAKEPNAKKEALKKVKALRGVLKGTGYEEHTLEQFRDERLGKHLD
jgi:hypothetical protein